MRKSFFTKAFVGLLLAFCFQTAFAQQSIPFSRTESPLSKPSSPVMDYAGVLDSTTKQRIEDTVKDFSTKSNPSVEIGVAVVKTTGGVPIFDYSFAVARGWGIGTTQDDNPGLLLLVAVGDRKYFTQISKDLEDELPDGIVGSLQRRYLVPPFKQGNYGKGIEDTINAYIQTIETRRSGETPAPAATTIPSDDHNRDFENTIGQICQVLGCLFVVFIFVMFAVNNSKKSKPDKNDRDRWGGGGGGGGSSAGADIAIAIIGALLSGSGGGSSSSSDWGSGGSSSWGGGSSGGWGGFGGGGDFGGGGSGGSW